MHLCYFAGARWEALNYWLISLQVIILLSERFSGHDVINFAFELFHSFLKVYVVRVVCSLVPFWFTFLFKKGLSVSNWFLRFEIGRGFW